MKHKLLKDLKAGDLLDVDLGKGITEEVKNIRVSTMFSPMIPRMDGYEYSITFNCGNYEFKEIERHRQRQILLKNLQDFAGEYNNGDLDISVEYHRPRYYLAYHNMGGWMTIGTNVYNPWVMEFKDEFFLEPLLAKFGDRLNLLLPENDGN